MSRMLSLAALLLFSTLAQADDAAKIEAELDKPTEVQYLDTLLQDVVTDLELRHRISMEIDQAAVEKATAQKLDEITITGELKDLQLSQVLNLLLPPKGLVWTIHEGVLLITSVEQEAKYVVTKVYKVCDFATDLEALQNTIQAAIDGTSWQANGGNVGAIARFEETKSLVVTHTAQTHRRVAELIKDLRATKAEEKK